MNENQQNPYNQHPQGEQMPPSAPIPPQMGMPMRPRRRMTWRERLFAGNTGRPLTIQQERTIPNWLTGKAAIFFFVAILACWFAFGYVPAFELYMASMLSVVLFFYGGKNMAQSWSREKEKVFLRNVFVVGLVARLLWVLYCYFFFNFDHYGHVYGDDADTGWYMGFAKDLTQWLSGNSKYSLSKIIDMNDAAIDDTGYPMWLGFVYLIVGVNNDVFVPFVLKCILNAACAILIYHVAKRHFDEGVARMAALFVALNPNMIYWCGNMFKESEMVFLCCLCVDLVDKTFTARSKLTFRSLLPGILAGTVLFFFRSALAVVIFLAMFAHIVMASGRVMSMGKKIIAGALVGITLLVGIGNQLRSQTQYFMDSAQSDAQQKNMEWRSTRKDGGNSFAKYAGKAVFAPLIFTIPFPTFNQAEVGQMLQVQLSGGSYIKNVFSYFVIYVMIMMLITGEWRKHVFILAYTAGYLASLALSQFAQSGRFHMPVIPMLMLFAAYGIQIAKTNAKLRKWFPIVLVLEVVACLAWNWFKLKGRGMI